MSGAFTTKYTDDQKDAIASAIIDRGTSYKRALELAAAGELVDQDGAKLAPFQFSAGYVRTVVARAKRQRFGASSRLSTLEPRDAVEVLRRRLVDVCADEIGHLEKGKRGGRDPEKIRQFGRALRELQAIPGPKDQATPAPGAKTNGTQDGGQTRGGMAGALLKAHRGGEGSPAPDAHSTNTHADEEGAAGNAPRADAQQQDEAEERGPGSLARSAAARSLAAA